MTSTTLVPLSARPRGGRFRYALSGIAVAACVPYLLLKLLWLSGSRLGIPADSVLLEGDGTVLHAVNALTLLMDAAVVLLVLALVRPWGRRLPASLLLLPLWVASGLLSPILVGVPGQLLLALFSRPPSDNGREAAFLDGWVAPVVYGSFMVQGLALTVLFAGYVRDRWGHALRGRIADLQPPAPSPLTRVVAALAITVATVPAAVHLLWALGARAGLSAGVADQLDAGLRLNEAVHALCALAAIASLLLLVFRVRPRVRIGTAVLLGWVGGSTLTCWGGWLALMAVTAEANCGLRAAESTTWLEWLAYSSQVTSGLLVLAASVLAGLRPQPAAGR